MFSMRQAGWHGFWVGAPSCVLALLWSWAGRLYRRRWREARNGWRLVGMLGFLVCPEGLVCGIPIPVPVPVPVPTSVPVPIPVSAPVPIPVPALGVQQAFYGR